MKIRYYYLRDPNIGDDERKRFDEDAKLPNMGVYDDSGPAEGGSVPLPRSIGLGTIIFGDKLDRETLEKVVDIFWDRCIITDAGSGEGLSAGEAYDEIVDIATQLGV